MSANVEAAWIAAEGLTAQERLELAERLLESVSAEGIPLAIDDPDIEEELARRLRNTDGCVPWAEFRRSLEQE